MNKTQVRSITQDFIVMDAEKTASVERCDTEIFQRLDENYQGFKGCELIACFAFAESWSNWEMHPHGDEVVILLSGEVTFVLRGQQGDESIELKQPGEYLIVPKGVWHTARTNSPTQVLFVTPGRDTQHHGNPALDTP